MRIFISVLVVFLFACATTAKAPVASPEVRIAQTSGVPSVARGITGSFPVRYAVRIANTAKETITLQRITVQSLGAGAYELPATSRPFDQTIAPESHADVELWASAFVADPTILGANGPVTLRLTLHFESPKGEFDQVVVRQVNAASGGQS